MEKLIIGKEYWFADVGGGYGRYLGKDGVNNFDCFSSEHPGGFGIYNVLIGLTECHAVRFSGNFSFTPKDSEEDTYPVTRAEMQTIYNEACPEWRDIISHWTSEIMGPFDDDGLLSKYQVDKMYKAATPYQTEVLNTIFKKKPKKPEYRVFMTRNVVQQAMIVLEAKNMTEAEEMAMATVEEEDWEVQDEGEVKVVEVELED